MTAKTFTRAFIALYPAGDVFAIEYYDNDGTIIGACGPLHHSEVREAKLHDFDYSEEDAEWLMGEEFAGIGAKQSYSLLDADALARYAAED